jgi:1,4-alpha-glucan branching enzyme
MPGDELHKFVGLRLLLAYMYALPGKKLLFMGGEFGQASEWHHDSSLDWHLLPFKPNAGLRLLTGDLNRLYRSEAALSFGETGRESFGWIEANDATSNVLSFTRRGSSEDDTLIVVCNFSASAISNYRLGSPHRGEWREVFNSDATAYAGSGRGNFGEVSTVPFALHGFEQSLTLDLPPLAAIYLKQKV